MPFPDHPDLEIAGHVVCLHLAGKNARVLLFGSRARGDSRIWSDIDVAVQADPSLPAGSLSALREALEESSCLLNVDGVDFNDADAARLPGKALNGAFGAAPADGFPRLGGAAGTHAHHFTHARWSAMPPSGDSSTAPRLAEKPLKACFPFSSAWRLPAQNP